VFANWRGFSGGQRDMFDEVLKFGSMIVDAFVAYQQPLFVYIPPHAELRGGAWVVVDSTINADVMEFYAAEDARGGVLEATGAASIKYRDKEIRATASRLDPVLIHLNKQLENLSNSPDSVSERDEITRQMRQREQLIIGVFRQIAIHFADLHDTPGRMKAKGVIRKQVQWSESREFFYWRLRRRLNEFEIANQIIALDKSVTTKRDAINIIKSWCTDPVQVWGDDRAFVSWLSDNVKLITSKLTEIKHASMANQLALEFSSFFKNSVSASDTVAIVSRAVSLMSPDNRENILKAFQEVSTHKG
jgi:acetyl-CoA carboxylase/biotin carboxylase 1